MPSEEAFGYTIQTGTDAELLALWRAADAEVAAFGYSRTIAGRVLTKAHGKEITDKITFYQSRVDAGTPGRGTTNFARFGRAT